MKTSISSYSFQYLISKKLENQFSVIKKTKELGFDAIEFITLDPHDGSSKEEYAAKLREEAKAQGVEISCYAVGIDMLMNDKEKVIEGLKKEVDIAEILGTKLLRHDIAFSFPEGTRKYNGFINYLPKFTEICREITQYAKQKGIRTCTENHGRFSQDSDRVELLVNTIADENFGLLVDTGNFLCVDENPVTAVGRCAPYAFNVHIKDFIFKSGQEGLIPEGFIPTRGGNYLRGTVAGHGIVPLKQCVGALKMAGYDGYLTLEFEGKEEIEYALSEGCKYIKRLAEL